MKRNFTLIEALIAVIIVGLSSAGLYSALMTAKNVSYGSRIRLEAQRFSYDISNKMMRLSKAELQTFITEMNAVTDQLIGDGNNKEYIPLKGASTTTDDSTSLNVHLSQVAGKLIITQNDQTKDDKDDNLKEGDLFAKRIDIKVEWTAPTGATLDYTTTIYRYFQK